MWSKMIHAEDRVAKSAFVFLVALLAAAFFLDGGPHFKHPARAALMYHQFEYGGGNGFSNIYHSPNWSFGIADTSGRPDTTLLFQRDCNLVDYRLNANGTTTVVWASGVVKPVGTSCSLAFQTDGNVVIYQAGVGAIWSARTNFGPAYQYRFDVMSSGQVDIWQYEAGYGWHWRGLVIA